MRQWRRRAAGILATLAIVMSSAQVADAAPVYGPT
jgi:hypothetical protein